MTLSTKQRARKYGLFTPAQIAEALEIVRTLPPPPHDAVMMGTRKGGMVRHNVDLPVNLSWRLQRLTRARAMPLNRCMLEILALYVVSVQNATLDGVPELYADFLTPEGLRVLTEAMCEALSRALGQGPTSPLAERMEHSRFPVPPSPLAEVEPEPATVEATAFDTFSLTGEDDLPTLCITIRGETAAAMSRGLDDVRQYVLDHDVEEWDGVKAQDVGYEYECSALDDGTPVRELHATVTKALVAR